MGNKIIPVIAVPSARPKQNRVYKPRNRSEVKLRVLHDKVHVERMPRNGKNSLKDYGNISREVLDFIKEHNFTDVPSAKVFKDKGRSDIISAANVHYGSLYSLRAEMISRGDLKLEG